MRKRVVTLGGGHGQATMLAALSLLDCDVTAVVSVADDGGCSGKLRSTIGMPPPGDVRRCLTAVAIDRLLAERFEERIKGGVLASRCVGNLILSELWAEHGSLTIAADRVASWLGTRARVLPVAEAPATLQVYDGHKGELVGESNIERTSNKTLIASTTGPETATLEALSALAEADLIFMGPGSFVGSTLAVLTTGQIAHSTATSRARKALVKNISEEERTDVPGAVDADEHERFLRDHLVIGSLGENVVFDVLRHVDGDAGRIERADGSVEIRAPLVGPSKRAHEAELLARAIGDGFDIPAQTISREPTVAAGSRDLAEQYFKRAVRRLTKASIPPG